MKTKPILLSLLWSALFIGTAFLFRHTEHFDAMFVILVAVYSSSLALLTGRCCARGKTASPEKSAT